jgi:hypothetical protein
MTFSKRLLMIALTSVMGLASTIPAGTEVQVRLGQTIKSDKAKAGDVWEGTLAADLVVDGVTIAKRGANVHGRVVDAPASGRLSDVAETALQLTSVTVNSRPVPVLTESVREAGGNRDKRNPGLVGGGAAGTGGAAATGKKDISFPVESILTFVVR